MACTKEVLLPNWLAPMRCGARTYAPKGTLDVAHPWLPVVKARKPEHELLVPLLKTQLSPRKLCLRCKSSVKSELTSALQIWHRISIFNNGWHGVLFQVLTRTRLNAIGKKTEQDVTDLLSEEFSGRPRPGWPCGLGEQLSLFFHHYHYFSPSVSRVETLNGLRDLPKPFLTGWTGYLAPIFPRLSALLARARSRLH